MRPLAAYATADQLLDYLASDRSVNEWTYYLDLGKWDRQHNFLGERHVIGTLYRNLSVRRLADIRLLAKGLALVGDPDEVATEDEAHPEDEFNAVYVATPAVPRLSGGFGPMLGGNRTDEILDGTTLKS